MWQTKALVNVSFSHFNNFSDEICFGYVVDLDLRVTGEQDSEGNFSIIFQQFQRRILCRVLVSFSINMSHANTMVKLYFHDNCSDYIQFAMISFFKTQIEYFVIYVAWKRFQSIEYFLEKK